MFVVVHSGMKTDGNQREQHVYSFDIKRLTKTESLSVVLVKTYCD